MRIPMLTSALALLFMLAPGCGRAISDPKDDNPIKSLELSTRSLEFVNQGGDFAFNFIERVNASADKDYVISPVSMQFLLGMILDGARGDTAEQICKVLGYGKGETGAVNEFCRSLLTQLPAMDKKTKLSIANAIFVDDGWPLLGSYMTDVRSFYDAEVENLDFSSGDAALKRINDWCSKHTEGLIPKVLDEVSPDMLAYLLNALYFKSQWSSKFEKSMTADEDFTYESGGRGKVKMMKQHKELGYISSEAWRAVRVPYGNGAFAMYVFLPREGYKVADVAAALKATDWQKLRNGYSTCDVELWMPRFETKFGIKLNDLLSGMGMPLAFDPKGADFTAMSEYALCLSFVRQDAVIKVDEEGTEAAAVSSAGMMKNTSVGPSESVVFHADRPFLYLIAESGTGVILFAGRYGGK